ANPKPGEITLAHNGILFLDELPEFPRHILDLLRQPLEDHRVTISRVGGSITYPARFILAAAMNPCPCGYWGDPIGHCACQPTQIAKYYKRISGPFLDRIDLIIEVPRADPKDWRSGVPDPYYTSDEIRGRVMNARMRQSARGDANAYLSHAQLAALPRTPGATDILHHAMTKGWLTGRTHDKVLKVAQTIADLANSDVISEVHVSEALQYRFKRE
ncbi:ATP-binding protein, partial [bacterium]|nr:ATP-binding protein [bacterium]